MKRSYLAAPLALALALAAPAAGTAQSTASPEPSRSDIRDQLVAQLAVAGPRNGVHDFHQSTSNEWAVVGHLRQGLKVSDELEIIAFATKAQTIVFNVYPHYHGDYINLHKVKNSKGLMEKLLTLNDSHFFWWGADDEHDIYAAFKFTLESGYPKDAIDEVVDSIPNVDPTVGELRPFVDMPATPKPKR